MDLSNFGETMPTIEGIQNRLILANSADMSNLPQGVIDFINETRNIADSVSNLSELEQELTEYYGSKGRKVYSLEGVRCANVFAFPGTASSRREDNVIIANGETNISEIDNGGNNIKDPFGWMSVNPAPTPGYGVMGKNPELRPMNKEGFDGDFYEAVMNVRLLFEDMGVALEIKQETGEVAAMPLIAMRAEKSSAINELLEKHPDTPSLIGTAKYHGINGVGIN